MKIILLMTLRGRQGLFTWYVICLIFFHVNCDLHIVFCVKRDWGYLRETWCVIYFLRDPWFRHPFPRENYTNPPKIPNTCCDIIFARFVTICTMDTALSISIKRFWELSLSESVHVLWVVWQWFYYCYHYAQSDTGGFWGISIPGILTKVDMLSHIDPYLKQISCDF